MSSPDVFARRGQRRRGGTDARRWCRVHVTHAFARYRIDRGATHLLGDESFASTTALGCFLLSFGLASAHPCILLRLYELLEPLHRDEPYSYRQVDRDTDGLRVHVAAKQSEETRMGGSRS